MNGTKPTINQREGRVEVCYEDAYHTICDDLWDENDAIVVCNRLNITETGMHAVRRPFWSMNGGQTFSIHYNFISFLSSHAPKC